MAGKLFLVGTPIGNLGDFSPRAAQTLRDVDFIAAEDTRVTRGLLTHFDIHKQLVSYYEHNSAHAGENIIGRLLSGESCALVTDAGMPAISDPGGALVTLCGDQGIEVFAVPGACALTCAVALSPLYHGRFCFEGFLSTARKARREHLQSLVGERRAMVFYEAPHKLVNTLGDLLGALGNRRVTICREITKFYEQTLNTTLLEALDYFALTPPRGEFALVVEGAAAPSEPDLDKAVRHARTLIEQGMSVRDASREAAQSEGLSRRELYEALNRLPNEDSARQDGARADEEP